MIRPLYKAQEPFMDAPEAHGYMGVLMYDDKDDNVQCHLCGKWYGFLATHLRAAHKTTTDDYKIRFGLPINIGLCGQKASRKRSILALKMIAEKRPGFGDTAGKMRPGFHRRRKFVRNGKGRWSFMAQKNKFGLCKLQMKARYDVVCEIVGRHPTQDEIEKWDHKLERGIWNTYRGINGFRRAHNIPVVYHRPAITEISMAAYIRKLAQELGRKPKSMDVKPGGLISRQTIYNKFGSWEAALQYSGLK